MELSKTVNCWLNTECLSLEPDVLIKRIETEDINKVTICYSYDMIDEGIIKALGASRTIKRLSFHEQNLGNIEDICQMLENHPTIKELDFECCFVGSNSQHIFRMLQKNTIIEELCLTFEDQTSEEAANIRDFLKINQHLKVLVLSHNEIGSEGMRMIFDGLKYNSALESLSIAVNVLRRYKKHVLEEEWNRTHQFYRDNGWEAVPGDQPGEAADSCDQDLPDEITNDYGEDFPGGAADDYGEDFPVETINDNLPDGATDDDDYYKSIEAINDFENEHEPRDDSWCEAVADMLRNNTTLTSLDLEGNHIGDYGGKLIFDAMNKNQSLQGLYFEHNEIGDECVDSICNCLKNNYSLTNLRICPNRMSRSGKEKIVKTLESHSIVEECDLGAYSNIDKAADAIEKRKKKKKRMMKPAQ